MQRATAAFIVSAALAVPAAFAQAAGQPSTSAASGGPAASAGQSSPGATAGGLTEAQRTQARTRLGVGGEAASVPDRAQAAMRQLKVDDVEDMDVYNGRGEKIGEVDDVVTASAGNQRYIVIEEGGFFGVGEDHAVLPLERFWVQGNDRLVVYGVTEQDIESMDAYRANRRDYKDVDDDEMMALAVQQP